MEINRERYEREFQTTLRSCSSRNWPLELCCVQRHPSPELQKARSCSRRFSSNCVGHAAPKRSSGCSFVLTNLRHNSPSAQCICTSSK